MNKPILTNKDQFPTDEIIFSHIGKSKVIWESLFLHIYEKHPDLNTEWRYYNDGKSWLMKVTLKSRTIFFSPPLLITISSDLRSGALFVSSLSEFTFTKV